MPPRRPRDTKAKRKHDRKHGVLEARRTPAPSGGTVWAPAPKSSAPARSAAPASASTKTVPPPKPSGLTSISTPSPEASFGLRTPYLTEYERTQRKAERKEAKEDRSEREKVAKKWKTEAIARAAQKHLREVEVLVPKKDAEGLPVLADAVTLETYKKARKELNDRLKKITASATPRSQTRGDLNVKELEAQNDFVRKVFEYEAQPSAAPKTSMREWNRARKKIESRAKKIRQGKWTPPEPKDDEPMLAGLPTAAKAIGDVFKIPGKGYSKIPGSEVKPMGIGSNPNMPTPGQVISKTFDLLTRPADYVRTAVARDLVEWGVIKGPTATKIRNAKSPIEAFLNKNDEKELVHGSDISQGVFKTPKAGLAIDILTDPLMYVGAGAARIGAKEAIKAAQLARRIEKADVGYDATKLADMTRLAAEAGDFKKLESRLTKIAEKEGVNLSDLGKTASDKFVAREVTGKIGAKRRAQAFFGDKKAAAQADQIRRAANFGALGRQQSALRGARAMREEAPGVTTRSPFSSNTHAPTHFGLHGVKEAAAWAVRNQYRPGVELRLLTPVGRRVAGLRIPLPANLRTGLFRGSIQGDGFRLGYESSRRQQLHDMREADIAAAVRLKFADEYEAAVRNAEHVKAQPAVTRREIRAAEEAVHDLRVKVDEAVAAAVRGDVSRPTLRGGSSATVGELTRLRNQRQFAHKINQQARNLERDTHSQWMKVVDDSLKPVGRDAKSLSRVMLTMAERSGSGTAHLPKLSAKEEQVVANLQQVAERLREAGVRSGTLERYLADNNYLPRQFTDQREGTIFAQTQAAGDGVKSTGQGVGALQHGRSEFELFSKADPDKIAAQIAEAFEIPKSAARKMAEDIFQAGRVRAATDLTARQIQRRGFLKADELNPLQEKALGWDHARAKKEEGGKTLFTDPGKNEGFLSLSEHADEVYEINPEIFDALPAERALIEKLDALGDDVERVTKLIRDTASTDPELSAHWGDFMHQLHKEREELRGVLREIQASKPGQSPKVELRVTGTAKKDKPTEWEWGEYRVTRVDPERVPKEDRLAAAKTRARRERREEVRAGRPERRAEARRRRREIRAASQAEKQKAVEEAAEKAAKANEPPPVNVDPTPAKNPTTPGSLTHASYPQLRAALSAHETPEIKTILDNWQDFGPREVRAFGKFMKAEYKSPRSWLAQPEFRDARLQAKQLMEDLQRQIKELKAGSEEVRSLAKPKPRMSDDEARAAAKTFVLDKTNRKITSKRRPEMHGRVTVQRRVRNMAEHLGLPLKTPGGEWRETDDLLAAIGREMGPPKVKEPVAAPKPVPPPYLEQPAPSMAGIPHRREDPYQFEVELPTGEVYQVDSLATAEEVIATEAKRTIAQAEHKLPYKPTGEYSQIVKDPRYGGKRLQPVLNPYEVYAWRTRSEARNLADRGTYEAIDSVAGRNWSETKSTFTTRSGDTYGMHEGDFGRADRLVQYFDPDDPSVLLGYKVRGSEEIIPLDDIVLEPRSLIRMGGDETSEAAIWVDAHTGREYVRADQYADIAASPVVGDSERVRQAVLQATGSTKIGDVEISTRLWPTDVIRDMRAERYRMGDYDVVFKTGGGALFGKVMDTVRFGVTTLFPAFHTRNMISDFLLSVQADSGILFHPIATAKMAALAMRREGHLTTKYGEKFWQKIPGFGTVNVPGWGRMKNEDFLLLMDIFGNRSNMQIADLMISANHYLTGAKGVEASFKHSGQRAEAALDVLNPAKKGGFLGLGRTGKIGHTAQEFSSRREDIMRMATLLQRLRRNGGDVADASMHMISVHFDYGDLSQFERRVVRNLFLFYTWYRRNIPRQLWQIVHRPGFFNAVAYSYDNLARGTSPLNQDWSKINSNLPNMEGPADLLGLVPDYAWHMSPVTMNWNGHTMTAAYGAPWADLALFNKFDFKDGDWLAGARGVLQLGNPLITMPSAIGLRRDLLTGREFKEDETSGAARTVDMVGRAIADWTKDKFGFDLPRDKYDRPVLPWALNAALSQIPLFGRASSYTAAGSGPTQDQGRMSSGLGRGLVRFLTGINTSVTPANAKPGESERLDVAWISRLMVFGHERTRLSMNLSNRDEKHREKKLAEYDDRVEDWLTRNNAPREYWPVVRGLGPRFYESAEDRDARRMRQVVETDMFGMPIGGKKDGPKVDMFGMPLDGGKKPKKEKKRDTPLEESLKKVTGEYDRERDRAKKKDSDVPVMFQSFAPASFMAGGGPSLPEGASDMYVEAAQVVVDAMRGRGSEPAEKKEKEPLLRDGFEKRGTSVDVDPDEIPRKRKVKLAKRILQLRREIKQGVVGGGMVPSGVPERFRGLVAKYAPLVEDKAKDYGLTGSEFLAKMLKGESNFGQTEVGPDTPYGNARGPAQFIPGTRQDFIDKFGIDPWRSDEEAVKAMAYHLDGKHYGAGGIQGYNPGINDDYYLNQDVGDLVKVGGVKDEKQLEAKKEKLAELTKRGHAWGIFDVPDGGRRKPVKTLWKQPKRAFKNELGITDGMSPLLDGASEEIMELGRTIARSVNHPVTLNSANRPGQGYDSDHLYGNALDIHALAVRYGDEESQRRGDEIAAAAIRAAGGTEEQVRAMVENEGSDANAVSIQSPNGKRVQVIWKSDVGGNHWNHVHVGIDQASSDPKTFLDRSKPMSIMQQVKADAQMKALTSSSSSSTPSSSSGGGGGGGGDYGGSDGLPARVDSDGNVQSGLSFGLTQPDSIMSRILDGSEPTGSSDDPAENYRPAIRGSYRRGRSLLPGIEARVEQLTEESKRRLKLLNL